MHIYLTGNIVTDCRDLQTLRRVVQKSLGAIDGGIHPVKDGDEGIHAVRDGDGGIHPVKDGDEGIHAVRDGDGGIHFVKNGYELRFDGASQYGYDDLEVFAALLKKEGFTCSGSVEIFGDEEGRFEVMGAEVTRLSREEAAIMDAPDIVLISELESRGFTVTKNE